MKKTTELLVGPPEVTIMPSELSRISVHRQTGDELLHANGSPIGPTLLDFWRWSSSDLISNATRGVLAEFIVTSALEIAKTNIRDVWSAFDLITPEGITVEVKSAAFVQSWAQRSLSSIIFRTHKTRYWDADTNIQTKESRRQAKVYVFALLAHKDKATIDPLNVNQWEFFVLPTKLLDARTRSQHSITLRSLEKLAGKAIPYASLREAVSIAARSQTAG